MLQAKIKFPRCYIYNKSAYLFQEKIKCSYIKVGFGRRVSLRNRTNKELSTEEIGTKCVGSAATLRTDCWVFWPQ